MLIYLQMLETPEERSKFESLYLRYRGLMHYVAMELLHNRQDAEDAVHQAFLSVLQHLQKISDIDCPETRSYLVIITERKAIDLLRERQHLTDEALDEGRLGVHIPLPGDNGLADALAKLPPRYREILLLRFDCGYSTRELADMLDMDRATVQKLIWRAREALKKTYGEGGGQT